MEGAGWAGAVGFHRFDPGAGRALVEPGEVGFKGTGGAFGAGFNRAVVEVADPAGKAEAAGFLARGVAEPDALDTARDDGFDRLDGGLGGMAGGLG